MPRRRDREPSAKRLATQTLLREVVRRRVLGAFRVVEQVDAAPVHHRGTRGAMLRRCQEARWELESEIWLRMRVNSAVVGRAAAGTEALRKAVIVRDEVVGPAYAGPWKHPPSACSGTLAPASPCRSRRTAGTPILPAAPPRPTSCPAFRLRSHRARGAPGCTLYKPVCSGF